MENKSGGKKGKSVAFKLSSTDAYSAEFSEAGGPAPVTHNKTTSDYTRDKSAHNYSSTPSSKMDKLGPSEMSSIPDDYRKSHSKKKNKNPQKKKTVSTLSEKSSGAIKKSSKSGGHRNVNIKKSSSVRQKRMSFPVETPLTVTSKREFQLNNVVRSAVRCLSQLRTVKDRMGGLVSKDEQLSQGLKKLEKESRDFDQLAQLSQHITILSREAFLPAHRLNQAAICLHNTEDLFRSPTSVELNFSEISRMKIPPWSFNSVTVTKLAICVQHATEFYNKFNCKGAAAENMQDILLLVVRAFQDLELTAKGAEEIFKFMLYINGDEKRNLQNFIQTLPSVERVEMLVEIQNLRRTIDEIVIFLEKLSWGSYTVFCLASGKNVQSMPTQKAIPNPFEYSSEELGGSSHNPEIHSFGHKGKNHPTTHYTFQEQEPAYTNPPISKVSKLKEDIDFSSMMAAGRYENETTNIQEKLRTSSKSLKKKSRE